MVRGVLYYILNSSDHQHSGEPSPALCVIEEDVNHGTLQKMGLMHYTIDLGTASQATPRGRHSKRAGRA
jgi:hypothetical protein